LIDTHTRPIPVDEKAKMKQKTPCLIYLQICLPALFSLFPAPLTAESTPSDPPEIALGERLFLEARFAQSFVTDQTSVDESTEETQSQSTTDRSSAGGINCRACHLVDEQVDAAGVGMRSYADFDRLSPQPLRERDSTPTRPRNAQSLVNSSSARKQDLLFHHDGQFASLTDLVTDTLTGREYGWLPGEQPRAVAHIAQVIRDDAGTDRLGREFGGAYRLLFKGLDPSIPEAFRLPPAYRIDPDRARDRDVLAAVARLIAAYVADLSFSRDASGQYDGSPYDRFLTINGLPRTPDEGESERAYSRRLLAAIDGLADPQYVEAGDRTFSFHPQPFVFGPEELAGLRLFFRPGTDSVEGGNCIACHPAPEFSDFGFHNTGVTQLAYDRLHGEGAFAVLDIPDLTLRETRHEAYLPATTQHPSASGRFRAISRKERPGVADLGLWNIYANPDFPAPQKLLAKLLCQEERRGCAQETLLGRSIARFKTPGLRDLGHADPYLHDGGLDSLEAVIGQYLQTSEMVRSGRLRNGARELKQTHIRGKDIAPLKAFLESLNEDYE
jgi:cytochrome c peroxidase